jgi:hypothetical protein
MDVSTCSSVYNTTRMRTARDRPGVAGKKYILGGGCLMVKKNAKVLKYKIKKKKKKKKKKHDNKAKKKRVEPHDVSTAQWISTNSRIYEILSGSMSSKQRASYREFTRQIGDLLQVYSEQSVMVLDHEHRRQKNARGCWKKIYTGGGGVSAG